MPVIAMTREMGSRGRDIAIGLAKALGIRIVHHNLIEHGVSEKLDAPESDVHRHLEGSISMLDRWLISGRNLSGMTRCEVLELAEHGNVLLRGWGSTQILRPVGHILCVRVCAPLEKRVATMMERLKINDAKLAREEIRINDLAHARMLSHLTSTDWQNPLLYDLVINTDRVPIDEGVALIKHMLTLPSFQESADSNAHLTRLRIESKLRTTLANDVSLRHDAAVINFEVDPRTHHVTLSGGVRQPDTIEHIVDQVRRVPGVPNVSNQIMLVRD